MLCFCFLCACPESAALWAAEEDADELIEIEVDDTETAGETGGEKSPKTEMTEGELREETRFNADFYGSIFYRLMMNQIKTEGSKEYDRFQVDSVRGDILFGLRLLNNRDMEGRAEFNLDTDASYYDFSLYNLYFLYEQPRFNLGFFHREWLLDFDDPLRLLDSEVPGFFSPVVFYKKSVIRYALFGRDHYGIFFNYDGLFRNRFCVALPADKDDPDRLFVIEKISRDFSFLTVSGNFILIDQDYRLPVVNEANWAEFRGVWYEFATNSFYDPEEKDYRITATGEVSAALFGLLTLFGEAGIDHKAGGYYGLSSQKAASSGNIPYFLLLESPAYRAFISAAGVQADLGSFMAEGAYAYSEGECRTYSFITNRVIKQSRQAVHTAGVKLRLETGPLYSENHAEVRKGGACFKPVHFDDYNYNYSGLLALPDADEVRTLRSLNKVSAGPLTFYPEVEYRAYGGSGTNGSSFPENKRELSTIEINAGASYDFSSRFGFYLNWRHKRYHEKTGSGGPAVPERVEEGAFSSWFAGLSFRFSENINVGIAYGLDPRLDPFYEHGYKYELSQKTADMLSGRGDRSWSLGDIFNIENRLAKNNYICITGSMKF